MIIKKQTKLKKRRPDYRDYTLEHEKIKPMLEDMRMGEPEKVSLPSSVDLRPGTWGTGLTNWTYYDMNTDVILQKEVKHTTTSQAGYAGNPASCHYPGN
jgi:hypothetical protein